MRQLAYALRFQGEARPIGIDGNVLTIATTAPGRAIRSWVGTDGLRGSPHPELPGEATCETELVLTGETMFQQAGTITFGAGEHRLCFSTVGSGHLSPALETVGRHGAVIWRVDGGEGRFAGASGMIASNFVVSDAGEIMDHHLGVVFVR